MEQDIQVIDDEEAKYLEEQEIFDENKRIKLIDKQNDAPKTSILRDMSISENEKKNANFEKKQKKKWK